MERRSTSPTDESNKTAAQGKTPPSGASQRTPRRSATEEIERSEPQPTSVSQSAAEVSARPGRSSLRAEEISTTAKPVIPVKEETLPLESPPATTRKSLTKPTTETPDFSEPQEITEQRRESTPRRLFSKVLDNMPRRKSSAEPQPTSARQGAAEATARPRRSSLKAEGISATDKPEISVKEETVPHDSSPTTTRGSLTKPMAGAPDLASAQEIKEQRRESIPRRLFSKVLDNMPRRRSSRSADTGIVEDPSVGKPTEQRRSLVDEDRRRSTVRSGDISADEANQLGEARNTAAYNPFGSFQRRVSISNPEADASKRPSAISETIRPVYEKRPSAISESSRIIYERRPSALSESIRGSVSERKPSAVSQSIGGSIFERKPTESVTFPEIRKSSIRAGRKKSISVVDLSKQDIAICFFPEEPDWDDDDDDDDIDFGEDDDYYFPPKRPRSDSMFPDPGTPYDWTQRERWHSRLVYLIALVTYSISFSNIYHFPALVYHYGGIAFLIPYTIFTIILGYPLHFLESSLGQYSQSGPVRVWDAAPIARGIGWSMFLLCLIIAYYYNMYAAYSVIYFARCFNAILPWQDCDEPATSNYSCVPRMCVRPNTNHYTPAEHYFFDHVLQIRVSSEILGHGLGPMVWPQVMGFLFAWILVYVAIIQSVRSIGKVVFVLVVLPYFILLMLLTAGFMLQGSSRGLKLLFTTNFNNLLDIQLWRIAAEEVFFELGICQGTPLAYGSYCHHRNPTHIDSAIICLINYCTSILCAVVIFLILGALAMEMGAPVADVLHRGPGIVFIAYPEALSRVPGSHIWCIMFFLMLFSVTIGTQIAVMETVMTVVYDEFSSARPYRWLINLLICCCLFMLGIILCTSNGYFVVHLLDRMAGTMPRLPIAVCMVGTIVLIYGTAKYCEDIHFMTGYYPNMFIRLCFVITPFLLLALTIPTWVLKEPLMALNRKYSQDAINVGWFTIWFILVWILLGAIYWCMYCYSVGQLKNVWRSLNSWGPRNFEARIARTEFSSEEVSNFTKPWDKKGVRIEAGDVG